MPQAKGRFQAAIDSGMIAQVVEGLVKGFMPSTSERRARLTECGTDRGLAAAHTHTMGSGTRPPLRVSAGGLGRIVSRLDAELT